VDAIFPLTTVAQITIVVLGSRLRIQMTGMKTSSVTASMRSMATAQRFEAKNQPTDNFARITLEILAKNNFN
jgi:hypothetical protein